MWNPLSLTLKWGPYDKPDPEQQQKIVSSVVDAAGGSGKNSHDPLITRRTAVEKLKEAGVFNIDNIGAYLEALEEEREEARQIEEDRQDREVAAAERAISEANKGSGAGGAGANSPSKTTMPSGDNRRANSGQKDAGQSASRRRNRASRNR